MSPVREVYLSNGHYYHVYSRSIAKFVVFNKDSEYNRMLELININQFKDFPYSYTRFKNLQPLSQFAAINDARRSSDRLVEIISFCLMPTHIHLTLKQVSDDGISLFIGKVLNSYTKYFNSIHKRSGPLWTGRFKNVSVVADEQLLHLTRYIHLNPTSANLVKNPEDWLYSSYIEYISKFDENNICKFKDLFSITPKEYKKFVNDHRSYQRDLSIIKSQLLDNYTG